MGRAIALAVAGALLLSMTAGAAPKVAKLRLGIAGDVGRFRAQTRQASAIRHIFLGWLQGDAWGRRIEVILPQLAPNPMLHLGIGGPDRRPRTTPLAIARGSGDVYFARLNKAIAAFKGTVYVRPMAEMNNPATLYAPVTKTGRSKGAAYSPQAYRNAFCRMYLILHGGARSAINAALSRAGLPPLGISEDLPVNAPTKLRVIWNPLAGIGGWQVFYPGDRWVDLIGNDIYAEGVDFSRRQNEALYAFARQRKKRYSLPEFGVSVDQPEFLRYICDFIRSHAGVELAAYFNSKGGSPWDLGNKPRSRQTYRECITPLEA